MFREKVRFGPTWPTAGWTTLLASAGYKLRENFSEIDQYVGTASNAIIAVLVIGYVWRLWTHRGGHESD